MFKLRISIRTKVMLLVAGVLLVAMGSYLYLASTLFVRDKLAYIYDLNASIVRSLSEQTRADLQVLGEGLRLMAQELEATSNDEQVRAIMARAFARRPSLLRIEIMDVDRAGRTIPEIVSTNEAAVAEQPSLGIEDLDELRRLRPLPVDAVVGLDDGEGLYLQNSSLPPDIAILTVALRCKTGSTSKVLVADLSHQRMLRIFGHSNLYETYLIDQHGIVLAHPDARRVVARANVSKSPFIRDALTGAVREGVKRFTTADGVDMLGAYAQVGMGRLMVCTQLPRREALRASDELIRRSLLFGLAILLVAFIVSLIFSRLLTAPLRRLLAATDVVGGGDLGVRVAATGRDEIGDLGRSFNNMAEALKDKQTQLVQSEKLAAFGQLGAGVTHEVKNPIAGIIGFAQLGQGTTELPEAVEFFELIETEGKRCTDILHNFLRFAKPQGEHAEAETLDLNDVVRGAVRIFKHQLSIHGIRIALTLCDTPLLIRARAAQLQQVLLNLAINGQQAMQRGGQLQIQTQLSASGASALVCVADNGSGMSPDVLNKVFEPFFTTKPKGKGTGLGLSVSFGIVRDHGGAIRVHSEPGEGTTFTIELPLCPGTVDAAVTEPNESGSVDVVGA